MVDAIEKHMQTYARMQVNEAQGHKDPSDDTRFDFYRKQGLDLIFNKK